MGGYSTIWLARALPPGGRVVTLESQPNHVDDLIFIDADKPSYPEYWRWALRLSHAGTLIVADNAVRDGAVADSGSGDPNVQAVR